MEFPDLASNVWRSNRPYIVTLVNGDRMPAYPVIGKVKDGSFFFGAACQDKMWLIEDRMIESPLITEGRQSRILALEVVTHWEALVAAPNS